MNILLWILQGLMAIHTVIGALWKLSNSEEVVPSLSVIPHGVWISLSVVEIMLGLFFILPAFKPTWKILISIAALGVTTEMLVFSVIHSLSDQTQHGPIVYWLVVAFLCIFIAYSRHRYRPL